ncbi:MAG TPA: LPS assembly lipoprotein LptE [Chthoniobacterales bacterium]
MGGRWTWLLCLSLAGCAGYTIGPIQPGFMRDVHRLAVPIFENRTVEPGIETLVTTTMIRQLQQDGTYQITGADRADAELRGAITDVLRAQIRSVTGNVLASSEFSLTVRLHLEVFSNRTNGVIAQKDVDGSSRFFVGNDPTSQERDAIPLAVQDAAVQATSFLSEGW